MKKILLLLTILPLILRGQNFFWSHNPNYGKTAIAVTSDNDIYMSTDFGATWTSQLGLTVYWRYCSISDNGNYALVCREHSGNVEKKVFSNWSIVSQLDPVNDYDAVSVSSTGQYQLVCATTAIGSNGYVYYTVDYGASWNQSIAPITYWQHSAISGSGIVSYIGSDVSLYKSVNYGGTFNQLTLPSNSSLVDVSTDYTGSYVYITVFISGNSYLYRSIDGGASWNGGTWVLNSGVNNFVSVSSSGKYVTYVEYDTGHIHYSSDFGVNWNLYSSGYSCTNIDMSADGKYQLVSTSTYLLRSSDYGATWTQLTSAGNHYWNDVGI